MSLDAPDVPDWEELRAINDVAKLLQAAGDLTRDAYDELWARGVKACNGHLEYIQALTLYADPDWAALGSDEEGPVGDDDVE